MNGYSIAVLQMKRLDNAMLSELPLGFNAPYV